MIIYLIRHALSNANLKNLVTGNTEDNLSGTVGIGYEGSPIYKEAILELSAKRSGYKVPEDVQITVTNVEQENLVSHSYTIGIAPYNNNKFLISSSINLEATDNIVFSVNLYQIERL